MSQFFKKIPIGGLGALGTALFSVTGYMVINSLYENNKLKCKDTLRKDGLSESEIDKLFARLPAWRERECKK